jgi:hypothetical protein
MDFPRRSLTWFAGCAVGLLGCERNPSPAPALSRTADAPAASSVAAPPGPRVALSGASSAAKTPEAGPRIYAKRPRTWIYAEPRRSAARLGYLRAGASAASSGASAGNEGCPTGWYPVKPRGFVCGAGATLSADDPIVRATRDFQPDFSRKLPYVYGTVRRPGPLYRGLPSAEELERAEPELDERMTTWLSTEGERGASYAQDVWLGGAGTPPDPASLWKERTTQDVPLFLTAGARLPDFGHAEDDDQNEAATMRPRAGYSFLRSFVWQGRRYGLTSQLTVAPLDRFRPIRGSDFRGVEPGKDIAFPFAFVRGLKARFWSFEGGRLVDAGAAPYRAAVKLTGKQNFFRSRLHYETEGGQWLSDADASRLDPVKRLPGFGKNGEKWLDVNLTKQTLVAYQGDRAVYATLISSGEAGLEDPEHTTATKRGIFRIHTKHVTSTMSSDEAGEEFELRDVPYVQYFDQGYALHGAYWHDRFGTPKSHGCINLSPEDARRLFFFTEPAVPEGWHGALLPLTGTVVFVHQ